MGDHDAAKRLRSRSWHRVSMKSCDAIQCFPGLILGLLGAVALEDECRHGAAGSCRHTRHHELPNVGAGSCAGRWRRRARSADGPAMRCAPHGCSRRAQRPGGRCGEPSRRGRSGVWLWRRGRGRAG
jgi:hypothetical protein